MSRDRRCMIKTTSLLLDRDSTISQPTVRSAFLFVSEGEKHAAESGNAHRKTTAPLDSALLDGAEELRERALGCFFASDDLDDLEGGLGAEESSHCNFRHLVSRYRALKQSVLNRWAARTGSESKA